MEKRFRLATTEESFHVLGMSIHNLDRRLFLYPIAKLREDIPYCLLPREGYWITNHV